MINSKVFERFRTQSENPIVKEVNTIEAGKASLILKDLIQKSKQF